ncbi:unnamed protein product [Gulo gulo]|uniref:Uncharacterized protein n=1 Tax=Gulo gulo TaxID=48420 RepID=A0A9X9Q6Z5_GULGU|nr:unnamed protein product [Gulo gulo]
MKLTVFKSKPSSFPSHKEFQNAMADLLNYSPPHCLQHSAALVTSYVVWQRAKGITIAQSKEHAEQ